MAAVYVSVHLKNLSILGCVKKKIIKAEKGTSIQSVVESILEEEERVVKIFLKESECGQGSEVERNAWDMLLIEAQEVF